MVMRSKQSPRCIRCRMHQVACICNWMPSFNLETRIVLIMHFRECTKSSATGPMALSCLENSERRVFGLRDLPLDLTDLFVPDRRLLYLYPRSGVPRLSAELLQNDPRPVTLIVPDGSWRQATRMGRRIEAFSSMETIQLPEGGPSRWGIRRETEPDRLSTFEAIARALGVLESTDVQQAMDDFFLRMVRTSLRFRTAEQYRTG